MPLHIPKHKEDILEGNHETQHIEWACLDPNCIAHQNHNEGHIAATMMVHEGEVHPTKHSSIMVGMIPCPVQDCHFVFPFVDDVWHHIDEKHKGVKQHGLAQTMMVLIPTTKGMLKALHAAYEIPGHGSRRGRHKPHDLETHHSSFNSHPRSEPHPLGVPRISPSHAQLPDASPHASGNEAGQHEEEQMLEDLPTYSGPVGGKLPSSPTLNHGGGTATHEELQHPGLYSPPQSSSQEPNQYHHMAGRGMLRPSAPHNVFEFPGCKTDGVVVGKGGMLRHLENDPNHRKNFSCWHCGRMFGHCNKSLLDHVDRKHAHEGVDEKLPCKSAGCTKTCRNPWHQWQHLTIDHHDKAAQQDHSKADGEAKDSHGHENGKDHNKPSGHEKDALGHERGKDHTKSDVHDKESQAHAKDNSHAKEDHGHVKGKDHTKDIAHGKEQDHAKAKETHNHANVKDHGKEDHAKDHEHHEDEWIDEEKSPKAKGKGKPTKAAKKPIIIPQRRVGTKGKKPVSSRMGLFKSKKKI